MSLQIIANNNLRKPSRVRSRADARSYAPESQPLVTTNPSFERPPTYADAYARGCRASGLRTPAYARASAR